MDKYDFTQAICNNPAVTHLWCSHFTNKLVYQVDGVQTVAGYLEVGHTYYRFRKGYEIGDLSNESKRYWSELFARKECLEKVTISGKDKTFNENNGKTAFVVDGRVYVFDSDKVSTYMLEKNGFKKDYELWVPFSNADGFLDDWQRVSPHVIV